MSEKKVKNMECDVCGKNLSCSSKDVSSVSMLSFSARIDTFDDPEIVNFMKHFMGQYEIDRIYNICGECTLKTFGVKPPSEEKRQKGEIVADSNHVGG